MSCYILHVKFLTSRQANSGNEIHIPNYESYVTKLFTCSILHKIKTKFFIGTLFWNSVSSPLSTQFSVMVCIDKYTNNIDQWRRLESLKGTNYTAYLFWSIILRAFIKERWNVKTDSRSSYSYCSVLSCLCYYCHSRTT